MTGTRLFLDLRGKSKDGKGSILIRLKHNTTSTTISTGIRVSPNNWVNQQIVKLPGAEALNAKLQEQKTKIDKAIAVLLLDDSCQNMTAAELKAMITAGVQHKQNGHLVSSLFDEYMNSGNLSEGTRALYFYTLKKVVSFSGEQTKIESINLKWLRSFDQYLSNEQSVNGKAIYLRSLRAVCNYAKHNGLISQYPFDSFQIKQEETRKRSVSVEQLRRFMDYPANKLLSMYRDYFMLMFYLIGINSKDLLLAKKSQIINGRLGYVRAKTGKNYSIRIEPEAEYLINKHAGKGEYILDAMDHCVHYRSFVHEMNDSLKLIGEKEEIFIPDSENLFGEGRIETSIRPIIPGVSTYYSRHTWATLAHELGISSDIISMALGHSFGNRVTFVYIQPDIHKVDEANRKVIDYLLNKNPGAGIPEQSIRYNK